MIIYIDLPQQLSVLIIFWISDLDFKLVVRVWRIQHRILDSSPLLLSVLPSREYSSTSSLFVGPNKFARATILWIYDFYDWYHPQYSITSSSVTKCLESVLYFVLFTNSSKNQFDKLQFALFINSRALVDASRSTRFNNTDTGDSDMKTISALWLWSFLNSSVSAWVS